MITLGLDIGSNSVGSAWVDTEKKTIQLGVSVFPAGVDETDTKRGSPVNQKRREKRSQRRSLARRAARKRAVRLLLIEAGLLPNDPAKLAEFFQLNPWTLRRDALQRALTPHEFGRVLVHLNQRRGAVGIETDPEDPEEGQVKEAIDRVRKLMLDHKAKTFGQFIADLADQRKHSVGENGKFFHDPIRNRQYRLAADQQLYADRPMIRDEFRILWETQRSKDSPLAKLLTDDLRKKLDDPVEDDTWRHKGAMFGQRRTYWDSGTLGRCDLEPTDHRCSLADMYAQEFRVIETVNNIRIEERGKSPQPLDAGQRDNVIAALRKQKTGSVATVRKALGIDKKSVKEFYSLNIERDEDREINTDWFYREIIHGVFTEQLWKQLTETQNDSINRAILKFDPDTAAHADRLRDGARKWWGLSADAAEALVAAWKSRPKLDKRLKLSRKAIVNLLPYMNRFDETNNRWPTQIEARQQFIEDGENGATVEQRRSYALNASRLTKSDRRFIKKHPDLLPPAPMLANPVVRKAVHEVRRHITGYIRKFGRKPDRIVIELTRSAKQSEKVRNNILSNNRKREKERKDIEAEFKDFVTPNNPMHRIVDRVRLWNEQKHRSAYSDTPISREMVGKGTDLEIDHIVPISRSQDNGFNNKVLCFRSENRDKTNETAREWIERKGDFAVLEQRLAHLEQTNPRKWENLHRAALDPNDPKAREDWANSQLTDTAYAATQVGSYLAEALYGGERDGKRRVFFTKGSYTAILRRDWQLIDEGNKNRGDHRHHAIDAVPIALTDPQIIQDLSRHAEEQEKAKAKLGKWPQRKPLDTPWGSTDDFRAQVIALRDQLTVSHRPVKRKVSGFLHKEDLWGVVDEAEGIFRIRCQVKDLNAKMLRMPVEESDDEVRKRLMAEFIKKGATEKEARKKAKDVVESGEFKRKLIDPSLGKGGLVRDWGIRKNIRDCLESNGINPDDFSPKTMADFAATGKLKMPSGVPIKSVITIAPISGPVKIAVKDPYTRKQAVNPRTGQPLFRFHISRNNHHMEILEDIETGEWSGEVVTVFQATQRIRPSRRPDGTPGKPQPAVDRSDRDGKRFVMSISEGEALYMRHPKTGDVGYFVVFKLKPARAYFIHHWDARRSIFEKDENGKDIPGTKREEIDMTPGDLKNLGPEPGKPPVKVRVDPLGQVRPLHHD